MVAEKKKKILLIGDAKSEVRAMLDQAAPSAEVTVAATIFDGLAELVGTRYAAVLANAEPIERRPEAAVKQLRELAGESRLLMFGTPTLEPLAKKMLGFGVDDYFVTPASAGELGALLAAPVVVKEKKKKSGEVGKGEVGKKDNAPAAVVQTASIAEQSAGLEGVPLAEVVLDALMTHPGDAAGEAVRRLNEMIGPDFRMAYVGAVAPGASSSAQMAPPTAPEGMARVSHPVRVNEVVTGEVHLFVPEKQGQGSSMQFLAEMAGLLSKVTALQQRHASLQKLAITDDLTGLYNVRYFRHFLSRILETARDRRSAVALSIFDIDGFKHYNDQYGHAVGDEILKQTATLIRRCVREHDHVARIGGDEFAVVFWEKEAGRQSHHENSGTPGKPPQTPEAILRRFQGMLASQDLTLLGAHGKGTLTISAGLAVYPWEAHSAEELIKLADEQLMFGAKKEGKNSIKLVSGEEGEG